MIFFARMIYDGNGDTLLNGLCMQLFHACWKTFAVRIITPIKSKHFMVINDSQADATDF